MWTVGVPSPVSTVTASCASPQDAHCICSALFPRGPRERRAPGGMGAEESQTAGAELEFAEAIELDPQPRRRSGLRLLCLHGHGSNNDISKLHAEFLLLREVHGVACDFLEASEQVSAQSWAIEQLSEGPYYTWFSSLWLRSGPYGVGSPGGSLHVSLLRIMSVVEKHGPYDGIYGFSQGAMMAAALCNRTVFSGLLGLSACPFRFAILANSALASTLRNLEIAQTPPDGESEPDGQRDLASHLALPVPASDAASLHLIGTRDWWRSESEEHARCFEDSTTYVHAHGHEIPMRLMGDEKLKQELGRFLQRFDPQQSGPRQIRAGSGAVDEPVQTEIREAWEDPWQRAAPAAGVELSAEARTARAGEPVAADASFGILW